jgi:hypothetical protein
MGIYSPLEQIRKKKPIDVVNPLPANNPFMGQGGYNATPSTQGHEEVHGSTPVPGEGGGFQAGAAAGLGGVADYMGKFNSEQNADPGIAPLQNPGIMGGPQAVQATPQSRAGDAMPELDPISPELEKAVLL